MTETTKEKFAIFNPEGGLGKIIASTAIAKAINEKYPERKLVVVTPWPEVYLNNPIVHRVYRPGAMPYFYQDYIKGKDTIVFKGEPYFNTGHLYNKQHLISSSFTLTDCHLVKEDYALNGKTFEIKCRYTSQISSI